MVGTVTWVQVRWPGPAGPGKEKGASWVAPAGNGCAQAAFRYTALARTRLVLASSTPGPSRSLIWPAVCSAMTWLISCLACSASRRKSASRTETVAARSAAAASAAVKPGSSGRPDCTHTVLGARSVRSPAARSPSRARSRSGQCPAAGAGPGGPGAGRRRSGPPSRPGPRAAPGGERWRYCSERRPGCPWPAGAGRDRPRTRRRWTPRMRRRAPRWRAPRWRAPRWPARRRPQRRRRRPTGGHGRASGSFASQGPGAPGGSAPRAAPPPSCRRRT